MQVRLKKIPEGTVLTVIRADGSVASQRNGHGEFFALHDITHFVVESELGFRSAFFGLLSEGWDFRSFTDKRDPRYAALPDEALLAEHIVGVLGRRGLEPAARDPELRALWSEDVSAEIGASLSQSGLPPFAIQPPRLAAISARLEQLMNAWSAIDVGDHLDLHFPDPPKA
jgi:hypothetical protein